VFSWRLDMAWKTIQYNRNTLYEQIWSQPILTVAKTYGISNVALGKICRKLRVPRPWGGYWAKVRNGEQVVKPRLAALRPGEPEEYVAKRWEGPRVNVEKKPRPEEVKKVKSDPVFLGGPRHPLVVRTEAALVGRTPDKYGMFRLWRTPGALDVRVSRGSMKRSLRIMDRIIKRLIKAGHRVEVTSGEKQKTVAVIDGQKIEFGLWEWAKRVDHVPTKAELEERKKYPNSSYINRWDYKPSGRLVLEINRWRYSGFRTTFMDRKRHRLEDLVDGFLESLGMASLDEKERERERIRQHQEWEAAEKRRIEEQRRWEEEQKRVQELLNQVANFQRSRQIREFISAVESSRTETGSPIATGTRFEDWAKWAMAYADRIDPLVQDSHTPAGVSEGGH